MAAPSTTPSLALGLEFPSEHVNSLLNMQGWLRTSLAEQKERCIELEAELEQRRATIIWIEQTLASTSQVLPEQSSLPATSPQGGKPTSSKVSGTTKKTASPEKKPSAIKSPVETSPPAQPSSLKKSKPPSVPTSTSSAKPILNTKATPGSKATAAKKAQTLPANTARKPQSQASTKGMPSKFSIRKVPFISPYQKCVTVTDAMKALLSAHPNQSMTIDEIMQHLFGDVPESIREKVKIRITNDLSKGKNIYWQPVPGKRGAYRAISKPS